MVNQFVLHYYSPNMGNPSFHSVFFTQNGEGRENPEQYTLKLNKKMVERGRLIATNK